MSNEHEERARARKSYDLARALEERLAGATRDLEPVDFARALHGLAVAMGADQWHELATQTGLRPPSATTIALTVDLLHQRIEWAERDPFDVFGRL